MKLNPKSLALFEGTVICSGVWNLEDITECTHSMYAVQMYAKQLSKFTHLFSFISSSELNYGLLVD